MPGQPSAPRMSNARIACGILWAVIAAGVGVGGVGELTIGNIGGAVVCIVIAALSGWYDYRVWTCLLVLIFANYTVGPLPAPSRSVRQPFCPRLGGTESTSVAAKEVTN
jgi:hypothetical protein